MPQAGIGRQLLQRTGTIHLFVVSGLTAGLLLNFNEARLTRRIAFEVNDPATQLDLVAHGLGIALVIRLSSSMRYERPGPQPGAGPCGAARRFTPTNRTVVAVATA